MKNHIQRKISASGSFLNRVRPEYRKRFVSLKGKGTRGRAGVQRVGISPKTGLQYPIPVTSPGIAGNRSRRPHWDAYSGREQEKTQ